jgi:orotidine-5'-phosphate decarboxylase
VRPAWAGKDDQKRTMTPAEAVAAGADYIVIGRPVLKAADRSEAVRKIIEEIETGVSDADVRGKKDKRQEKNLPRSHEGTK